MHNAVKKNKISPQSHSHIHSTAANDQTGVSSAYHANCERGGWQRAREWVPSMWVCPIMQNNSKHSMLHTHTHAEEYMLVFFFGWNLPDTVHVLTSLAATSDTNTKCYLQERHILTYYHAPSSFFYQSGTQRAVCCCNSSWRIIQLRFIPCVCLCVCVLFQEPFHSMHDLWKILRREWWKTTGVIYLVRVCWTSKVSD